MLGDEAEEGGGRVGEGEGGGAGEEVEDEEVEQLAGQLAEQAQGGAGGTRILSWRRKRRDRSLLLHRAMESRRINREE